MRREVQVFARELESTFNPYSFVRDLRERSILITICKAQRKEIDRKTEAVSTIDASEYVLPLSKEDVDKERKRLDRWLNDEIEDIANEKWMGATPSEFFERRRKHIEEVKAVFQREVEKLNRRRELVPTAEERKEEEKRNKRDAELMLDEEIYELKNRLDMAERRRVNIVTRIGEGVYTGLITGSFAMAFLVEGGAYSFLIAAGIAVGIGTINATVIRKVAELIERASFKKEVHQDT